MSTGNHSESVSIDMPDHGHDERSVIAQTAQAVLTLVRVIPRLRPCGTPRPRRRPGPRPAWPEMRVAGRGSRRRPENSMIRGFWPDSDHQAGTAGRMLRRGACSATSTVRARASGPPAALGAGRALARLSGPTVNLETVTSCRSLSHHDDGHDPSFLTVYHCIKVNSSDHHDSC